MPGLYTNGGSLARNFDRAFGNADDSYLRFRDFNGEFGTNNRERRRGRFDLEPGIVRILRFNSIPRLAYVLVQNDDLAFAPTRGRELYNRQLGICPDFGDAVVWIAKNRRSVGCGPYSIAGLKFRTRPE